jgi:hypothetical protein
MANPKYDNRKDYPSYAEKCLEMATIAPERQARMIQREMAAEWLKLAETFNYDPYENIKNRRKRSV